MGISIVLILIFHISIYTSVPPMVKYICQTGRIGVDFFLILSAIGLYYSLQQSTDWLKFYKKRVLRILPTYFILAAPYFFYRNYMEGKGVCGLLSDLFFYTALKGGDSPYYFVELILICYVLTPVFYKLISKASGVYLLLGVCLFFYVMGSIFPHFSIILYRIPIFIIGFIWAKSVYSGKVISFNIIWIGIIAVLVLYIEPLLIENIDLVDRMLYSLCSLPVIGSIAILLDKNAGKPLKDILNFCGRITLEIYMINFPVIAVLVRLTDNIFIVGIGTFVFTILFSYIANKGINLCLKMLM